jgi:two-component system sensor histidine kinase KdpD
VGEEMTPGERRELTENIHDRAARLSRLLGNLLRMTKLQSGTLKPDLQLQPLDEPLGAALSLMGKGLADRTVEMDIPPDLPLLRMDGVLMEQLFLNLLENILKYAPAGSPVRIAARSVGPEVEIEVADRGPGLADAELEKAFSLFYQGNASTNPADGPTGGPTGAQTGEHKGYGLGLAICRAIAQVHGGAIRAEHREGGGLAIRVRLPAPPENVSPLTEGANRAEEVL